MFAALIKAAGGKVVFWLIVSGLALGVYAGWRSHVWNQGYAAAEAEWKEAVRIERERQEEINRRSRESQKRAVEELIAEKNRLEKLNEELQAEADKDPHAGRVCLSRDSVRRLKRIQ